MKGKCPLQDVLPSQTKTKDIGLLITYTGSIQLVNIILIKHISNAAIPVTFRPDSDINSIKLKKS